MSDTDNIDDAGIFARTLWGEARGEGAIGMKAVACVIMNRVNNPTWWGNDVRSVCLHPYQFSCWNANDPNRPQMLAVDETNAAYMSAETIANAAMAGNITDITNGADNYYEVDSPTPKWAMGMTPCATIGHHVFFNV